MNAKYLAAALVLTALAAGAQTPIRSLSAYGSIRDTLAGGESAVFSFDVPAGTAARVVVKEEGIDIGLHLRRRNSTTPMHGLNFTGGVDGEELSYPAIADTPISWTIVVHAALPKATRGLYTISLEMSPADDRARAIAAARQQHHDASESGWGSDGQAHRQAADWYGRAASAALAAGDLVQAAESTFQGAREHDLLGETPTAIEGQLRALELFRQVGRRDREARVLNRLGDLSRKIGEVANAERYFQEALPLARAAQDPVNVADILNNSGLLMLVLGRFEEAVAQLQSAIPLAQEVDSPNVEGALTNNSGEVYRLLGEYEKSIESHQRGLVVVARLNQPRRTGRTLFMLAQTYFEAGDTARAEDALTRSLDLYEQAGDRNGKAEVLGFFARMQYASGQTDRALESFARAVPMLREVKNRFGEARVLTTWAEVDIERGETDSALERVDEALRLYRLIGSPSQEAKALYVRALALQRTERPDAAIAAIARAVDIAESMRGAIVRSELRTSYLVTVRRYFDLYIDLLQQRGSTAAAFELSERSRARTLLEGLAESASKIRKGVAPELVARQRAVQSKLNAKEIYRAQVTATDGDKSARVVGLTRDLDCLLEEWKSIQAKIRVSSPAYSALKMPEPVSVERVQALLDTGSALVEYHLGATRSQAWVVDRHSITVHDIPPAAKIDELARRYHALLSREAGTLAAGERETVAKDSASVGRRLADAAWKPVESRVRGKRVLLVADGALQYVPFGALPDGTGEPLLARHEIVYLPSASVLETIRRDSRPVPVAVTAAVFADPVFSRNDPRFAAERDPAASAHTRAADGGLYGRLRFSRREAEAIAAATPGAFQALDFSAAKHTLTERDLRRYNILHFATHGTLNTEHPELSGLVFSLVDRGGKPVDGFRRLHEIYNLDLDADLVVLSACRTALGREVDGEGLIGLTRGFMYAGASRVVSSVWNVDDRANALLMSRFYEAVLSKRMPPAAALRQAQLSLLREPRWSNPHYWAAFWLQGEWK